MIFSIPIIRTLASSKEKKGKTKLVIVLPPPLYTLQTSQHYFTLNLFIIHPSNPVKAPITHPYIHRNKRKRDEDSITLLYNPANNAITLSFPNPLISIPFHF